MNKKILLVASHSVIEPLGLLHLANVAKEEGWDPIIELTKKIDDLEEIIEKENPDLIGFTAYTGNHQDLYRYLKSLKLHHPNIESIVGGPHATYFPKETKKFADYVVMSEGFNGLRKILKGGAKKGIIHLSKQEPFPQSERNAFYEKYEKHKKSPIKSIIVQTGCPYACTYCYNSSTFESISQNLTAQQKNEMKNILSNSGGRLFPKSLRPVDDIISEIENIIKISPETKMIYFQDDVFGANLDWLREFSKKYAPNIPFHAQLRFEYANPKNDSGKERLELMKKSGCTGITLAIESSNNIIRKEILNRPMKNELIFDCIKYLSEMDYLVRTEQMIGLPTGATIEKTPINLELDLELLELNVKLRQEFNLPTIAWASTFAPYRGTKLAKYCDKHGFYKGNYEDIPPSFFKRSTLRFAKEWVGPKLSLNTPNYWMDPEKQKEHLNNLELLNNIFIYAARIKNGHKFAKNLIEQGYAQGGRIFLDKMSDLNTMTRRHIYDNELYSIDN